MTITIERLPVRVDGGVREGALVLHDGVLHAVLSSLGGADLPEDHVAGTWFLEAGMGPCGVLKHAEELIFATLDEAAAWVEREATQSETQP